MQRFLPLCRGVVPTELIRRPALLQGLTSLWYLHKWIIGLLLLNLCLWESKNIHWATVAYPAHSIRPVFQTDV